MIEQDKTNLEISFQHYQTIFFQNAYPDYLARRAALRKLYRLLQTQAYVLSEAIARDFSHRPLQESLLLEMYPAMKAVKYCLKHLKAWMKPRSCHVSWEFWPAKSFILPQPLGVVGIMAPWNYPIFLSIVPLAYAIAAGNRVLIKLSELSPETSEVFAALVKQYELSAWVDILGGDVAVAKQFAALPFHHLLFTGSTETGKKIMASASQSLTPITLELGGKSPVVISHTASETLFDRILMGKLLNAGQTCVAPDYILLPKKFEKSFEQFCQHFITRRYADLANNTHYTSIISKHHLDRLLALIENARQKNARIVKIGEDNILQNRLAFYVIFQATAEMHIMQEEIFGPILPIILYEDFQEALDYVKSMPKPLALYYFGTNRQEQAQLQYATQSGALAMNDTMTYVAIDDLPFGGVGDSGFGYCHAQQGFDAFSKLKPIIKKGRWSLTSCLYPPYGRVIQWFFKWIAGFKN